MTETRISVKRHGQYWKGVIRDERGNVIWECLHCHHNRDQSTKVNGRSALDCARAAKRRRALVAAGVAK